MSEIVINPKAMNLPFEEVSFETPDKIRLMGWFIPAEKPRGVILFCHSNAGNISLYLDSVRIFHQLRLSTFIFDYRGYGMSKGVPSENGTYLDAYAAWDYIVRQKRVPMNEIIISGRSLGGPIAAWLAAKHYPGLLIIESAFTSFPDIAAVHFPYIPARLISRYKYNTIEYLHNVKRPLLVVHSRNDEIVPFAHGKKIFENANGPKEFLEIFETHNDAPVTSERLYKVGLNNFITRYLGKK